MTNSAKKETVRVWRYPPRSEHPDAEIFVYEKWCKACGICYELCPFKVLSCDKAGYPVVSDPEACTACYLCEALCPEMAITVYREPGGAAKASKGEGARKQKSSEAGERERPPDGDDG